MNSNVISCEIPFLDQLNKRLSNVISSNSEKSDVDIINRLIKLSNNISDIKTNRSFKVDEEIERIKTNTKLIKEQLYWPLFDLPYRNDDEMILKIKNISPVHFIEPFFKYGLSLNISESINEHDIFNFKYFQKRAIVLVNYALHVKDKMNLTQLSWENTKWNYKLSPNLILTFNEGEQQFKVIVYCSVDQGIFNVNRFGNSSSNIKNKYVDEKFHDFIKRISSNQGYPSVAYNLMIYNDVFRSYYSEKFIDLLKSSSSLKPTLLLINKWYDNNEILQTVISLKTIYILLIYFVIDRKININLNVFQILRLFFQHLSSLRSKLSDKYYSMKFTDYKTSVNLEEFKNGYIFCLEDFYGIINLTPNLLQKDMEFIVMTSEYYLSLMNDSTKTDLFLSIYDRKCSISNYFDGFVKINNVSLNSFKIDPFDSIYQLAVYNSLDYTQTIVDQLQIYIDRALANRFKYFHIYPNYSNNELNLLIGFNVNHLEILNPITVGPLSNQKESKLFQEFWKSKCQTLHFDDSSVHEVVVWFEQNKTREISIKTAMENIFHFIFERFCIINPSKIQVICDSFSNSHLPKNFHKMNQLVTNTFNKLVKILMKNDYLPLRINKVGSSEPLLSSTNIEIKGHSTMFCEENNNLRLFKKSPLFFKKMLKPSVSSYSDGRNVLSVNKPFEVVVEFENSNKWPKNLNALQYLKTSLNIAITKLLSNNQIESLVSNEFVDINMNNIYFRLFIYESMEQKLLLKQCDQTKINDFQYFYPQFVTSDFEFNLFSYLKNDFLLRTLLLHRNYINGINVNVYSYKSTVKLCKIWIRHQMLHEYLPDHIVECMVAYIFDEKQNQFDACNSEFKGFIRFLNLLINYDWINRPLIVDLNASLSSDTLLSINTFFQDNRSKLPMISIFSNYSDLKPLPFSFNFVFISKQLLLKIQSVASKLVNSIVENISSNQFINLKKLFDIDLSYFDGYFRIKNDFFNLPSATRNKRKHDATTINYSDELIPIIDFNPIELFVKDLHSSYGKYLHFFWNKSLVSMKLFKVIGFIWVLDENDQQISKKFNKVDVELLNEIKILGKDIIDNYYICS